MIKNFCLPGAMLWLLIIFGCGEGSINTEEINGDEKIQVERLSDSVISDFDPDFLGLGKPEFGDLDSMIARKRMRVLVPYDPTFYYFDGSQRTGISFEILNQFEKALNENLKLYPPQVRVVFLPVNRDQMLDLLVQGYGDVGAGGLIVTEGRSKKVDFSKPLISGLRQIVVAGPNAPLLNDLRDLAGQRIFVRHTSAYHESLLKLSDSLQNIGLSSIVIENVDPYFESHDILDMLQAGLYTYSIMIEDEAQHWSTAFDELTMYWDLEVDDNQSIAWAFRKDSPDFQQMANDFITKTAKGSLMGNMLYNRYVKASPILHTAHSDEAVKQLSSLAKVFQKYGEKYDLPWLLLAAQGQQESGLDQKVVSKVGAIGIMQLMSSTAENDPINIGQIDQVENNIHAGAKYLRYLMDHYFSDQHVDSKNQMMFAIASYNAGPTRISRLRRKTASLGLNPNIWFDNVEVLVRQEVGTETVRYVSNIYKYYISYKALYEYSRVSGKKLLQ